MVISFLFGLPIALGIDVSSTVAAITALSLWGITEIGEIVRGALQSLPKGQVEAGKSIGMNKNNYINMYSFLKQYGE